MSGLSGALCAGQGPLFESVHPIDHREAATICAGCPVRSACRLTAEELNAQVADHRPIGTWGGQLYGGDRRKEPYRGPRQHGTEKGYYQHKNRGESACDECLVAMRMATRLRRKAQVKAPIRTSVRVESETKSGPESASTDRGLATVSTRPKGA